MRLLKCAALSNIISGKPQLVQFEYAGEKLADQAKLIQGQNSSVRQDCSYGQLDASFVGLFDRVYMIGDNPHADIRGANNAGDLWRSVLVRTGVFSGAANDPLDPADFVFDNVGEAVSNILEHEREL